MVLVSDAENLIVECVRDLSNIPEKIMWGM